MKIKRIDLIELHRVLMELGQEKQSFKFSYAVAKNLNIIKDEISAIQEAQTPDRNFLEYDQKRIELCQKFAKKDEKGAPVILNLKFIIEDQASFDNTVSKLRKEYKGAIDKQVKREAEAQELLKEEIEIQFFHFKEEFLPEDIKGIHLAALLPLLEPDKPMKN